MHVQWMTSRPREASFDKILEFMAFEGSVYVLLLLFWIRYPVWPVRIVDAYVRPQRWDRYGDQPPSSANTGQVEGSERVRPFYGAASFKHLGSIVYRAEDLPQNLVRACVEWVGMACGTMFESKCSSPCLDFEHHMPT